MRIADVMTRDLPVVAPGQTARDAAREMTQRKVKALPVCEGDRVVGIVTDWDLARTLAGEGDAANTPLSDIMSTDLVRAAPDAMLSDAAQMMAERQVHHLLVCDGERWEGMVHLDVEWSELTESLGAPTATFMAKI